MYRILRLYTLVGVIILLWPTRIEAQTPEGGAWRPIFEHEGVAFSYIFYREADSANNGVVVRLHNTNAHAVTYRFNIIFRDELDGEVVEEVRGQLDAHQQKTGSLDGLFWIPFLDGRSIHEVGLRGYKVERSEGEEAGARNDG